MFDAGTIIAHLELEDSDFDRRLRADVAKIEAFERGDHEVKLSVDLDQAGIDRARAQIERLDRQATSDAHRRGGILSWLSGTGKGLAGAAGPGLNTGLASRLISARTAAIVGGGGLALGAIPALLGGALGGGVGLAGAGVAALGAKELIGTKQKPEELYAPAQRALKQLQGMLHSAVQPLVGPLRQVFQQLPSLIRQVQGPLRQMFAGAATTILPLVHGLAQLAHDVLPLLGQAFRAAAPLLRPLLSGLSHLLTGLLPGITTLLRAARPAMNAFGSVLGTIGRGLGGMLTAMAPAIKASAIIFKGLGDLLGALFPIVGKLASAFARNLAPVFTELVSVVRQLLPFLRPIGNVLAMLAGAVLRDLVALLRPLADLLVRIAPSFDILAKALGQTFTVLESTGVFGVLAGALERLAKPLARLINDLVKQLAPYLPALIAAFGELLNVLVILTAAGLTGLINGLDWLIRNVPGLVPIIVGSYLAFKGYQMVAGWVGAARKAVEWLTAEEQINRVKSVANMIIDVAKRAWATAVIIAQYVARIAMATAAFIAENAATLGIIAGIALLVAAVIFLATHWRQTWGVIKNVAKDVWEFLTHGWGQFLFPQLFLIRKTVEFVRDHWRQAWGDITGAASDAWRVIQRVGGWIANLFTRTLPGVFRTGVDAIKSAWSRLGDVLKGPVNWVIGNVVNGLIRAFDWVSTRVGGPKIPIVPQIGMATGGRIPGYGGGDRHLALLEAGEAVVSKETTARNASTLAAWGVPGFQAGGRAGNPPSHPAGFLGGIGNFFSGLFHKAADVGRAVSAVATGNSRALTNAITDMIPGGVGGAVANMAQLLTAIPAKLLREAVAKLIGLGGSGSDIVRYAMQWIGKIPYVWGGTAVPGGADCSGFTGSVYEHFGIHAPRTSEAQGAWVKRSTPRAGGLAFYHSPGGGPDPGHVAIVKDSGHAISQGGGMGPIVMPLHAMPLLWTGIPPTGFGTSGGLGRKGSYSVAGMAQLWRSIGGAANLSHLFGAIGMAESGGDPRAHNPSGASGLWQILGLPFPGNPFDPSTNARMARAKYLSQGLGAWEAFTNGSYRQFMDQGGWLMPGMINGTGRPEAVLNPGQSAAFLNLAEAAHRLSRGGGDASLLRDVHLMLPEGTTVAEALREIGWALRTTKQQSFAGVPGA